MYRIKESKGRKIGFVNSLLRGRFTQPSNLLFRLSFKATDLPAIEIISRLRGISNVKQCRIYRAIKWRLHLIVVCKSPSLPYLIKHLRWSIIVYLSEMTKGFCMIGGVENRSARQRIPDQNSPLHSRSVAAKIAARPRSGNFFARFGREVHCSSRGLCDMGCPKCGHDDSWWMLVYTLRNLG